MTFPSTKYGCQPEAIIRILLIDIETAPNLAFVWRIFKENVGLDQIVDTGYVLCWSAKWLGEKGVEFCRIDKNSPKRGLQRIHALLDEADVVVHYNGKSFDIPTLQREFLIYGMTPPAPYKQVDLMLVVKDQFRFVSNKMAHVLQKTKIGDKVKHEGFTLWVKCMNGEAAAWRIMKKYNIADVVELEKLYVKLRPWIRNHPTYGIMDGGKAHVCPTCGSGNVHRRGMARTQVSVYPRYQCNDCGTWSRGGEGLRPTGAPKGVLRNIAHP